MKTLVIDIDGTICGLSERELAAMGPVIYVRTRVPFEGVVETIRELRKNGVRIVFYTARESDLRKETEAWFAKHQIEYDELVMGRPKGTIYLNDKALPLSLWRWNAKDALWRLMHG